MDALRVHLERDDEMERSLFSKDGGNAGAGEDVSPGEGGTDGSSLALAVVALVYRWNCLNTRLVQCVNIVDASCQEVVKDADTVFDRRIA